MVLFSRFSFILLFFYFLLCGSTCARVRAGRAVANSLTTANVPVALDPTCRLELSESESQEQTSDRIVFMSVKALSVSLRFETLGCSLFLSYLFFFCF